MKDTAPDIIVSDVMMPGMDGMRLAPAHKAAPSRAHIPVTLMTAINVLHVLPVQALLQKPFSAVERVDLIDKLRPWCSW
ncbi:hypothetical protein P0D69_44680 [Paraburkholderia sediminicola]|uniref:hypothetical protein n=1 Tax=Paraburkholderia sediminicola TaxID=458836 RepID=UPI0038B9916A